MNKYEMTVGNSVPSLNAKIFMAGCFETIKQACREFVYKEGLCVTVTPTTYIYTAGEEEGVIIGLINYPKFPTDHRDTLEAKAVRLAEFVMRRACQRNCTIQCDDHTTQYTRAHGGSEPEEE